MAKGPKKPTDDDETQSRRFMKTAKALDDAGELSPTEGDEAFEVLVDKVTPQRTPLPRR